MTARWLWGSVVILAIVAAIGTRAVYHQPALRSASNGTCVNTGCHAGIEDPHPLNLRCVECHGGNDQATTMETSHVREPMSPLTGKPMTREEWAITGVLDRLPKDYIRFINPGDLRVAPTTCGGRGCHPDIVERVKRSMHSTLSGYNALLIQFGVKAADGADAFDAVHGVAPAKDPHKGKGAMCEGAVPQLTPFPAPNGAKGVFALALANGELSENCVGCHINAYGANSGKGRFRSSGCSACHFTYIADGRSMSADESIRKLDEPRWGANGEPLNDPQRQYGHGRVAHPVKHVLQRVPDEQACESCHIRGTRILQNYKGVFHGARGTGQGTGDTPPDVHHKAGMTCVDCHTERDLHGDGAIYSRQVQAIEIQCETCHGTLTQPASLHTRGGRWLDNVFRRPDGKIYLRLKKTHRLLEVPQIRDSLDPMSPQFNEAASIAHGRWDDDKRNGIGTKEATIKGFSHLDRLTCYSCHATWAHNALPVRCTIDYTRRQRNLLDGAETRGIFAYRETFAPPTAFGLGLNPEGKVVPVVMQQATMNGVLLSRGKEGAVATFAPLAPHTNQKAARDCITCHPSKDGRNGRQLAIALGFNLLTTDPRQTGGVAKPLGVINARGYTPLDTEILKRVLRAKVTPKT